MAEALDALRVLLQEALHEVRRAERQRIELALQVARTAQRHTMLKKVTKIVSERNQAMRSALSALEIQLETVRQTPPAAPPWVSRCVVCTETAATMAVVHGKTAHAVYCEACAAIAECTHPTCPMCKQPGTIVRVFQSGITDFSQNVLL
jgi:hypothetical protein